MKKSSIFKIPSSHYVMCISALIYIMLVTGIPVQAQNSAALFKLSIYQTAEDPEWVNLMYSENPNIWEVESAFQAYYRENAFVKSNHTQNYKYWRKTIYEKGYLTDEGYIYIQPFETRELQRLARQTEWQEKKNLKSAAANWTALGPFETFYEQDGSVRKSSQVNAYTFDQSQSNPNHLYCGSETGDLYKSTDKAASWFCVTDNLVLGDQIHTVKFHPTNSNIALFATKNNIYRTINGGATWNLEFTDFGMNANDILFIPPANPANPYIVMVSGGSVGGESGGLYRSTDGGDSFTKVSNEAAWDLELKPNSNNIVYLLQSNSAAQHVRFYKSTDRGANFTEFNTGWFAGSSAGIDNTYAGARMAVTPANPEYIYVALLGDDVSRAQDVFWIGVYKSTNGGNSWTLPAGDPGGPYSATHYNLTHFNPTVIPNEPMPYQQEYYNLGIAASHTNPEQIMVGCLNLFRSDNGGATYQGMGGYVNDVGYQGYRHPDVQEIEINGNDIWVATDGGIDKYDTNWNTHVSYNLGINGTEYWGFDTGWNEDVLIGGRYHNGNAVLYENYPAGKARALGGGEKATGYINKGVNKQLHMSDARDVFIPDIINGNLLLLPNLGIYPSEDNVSPENSGEIEPDPRCYNHIYLTRDHQLHKSIDGGNNFTLLNSFGTVSTNRATRIEVSRSNPDVIYVCQRLGGSSVIWRTTNGGANWGQIGLPPGLASGSGFFISLSATNDQHLYLAVANGGNSTQKVYVTTNAGGSWTNLTTATLNGERPEQLMHQYGTNGGVYLATSNAVFYRNNIQADWQVFTAGAPADFRPERMRPFYKESKVRIATRNRGIWSSPLFENSTAIAQPMAEKLTSSCFDDLIQFEDFSVLDHTNATWAWSFDPAPAWIDDANIRNPMVRFGAAGSYDVTLTITNGQGQTDTKTINDMVTVGATCFCPPYNNAAAFYSEVGVGEMQLDNSCCAILTPNQLFSNGGIYHYDKIDLNNSFTLSFDLDLGDIDSNDADGATFVMQKQGFQALGGGIGVKGLDESVAVAFRSYIFDRIEVWEDGVEANQANNMPPINGNGIHPVTIQWDATTTTLTVDWENNGIDLTYVDDITANVFGGDPTNVIWGFTGGTGGLSAIHRVCNIQMNIDASACPPILPLANTGAAGAYTAGVAINATPMVNVTGNTVFSAPTVTLDDVFCVPQGIVFEINTIGCAGVPDGSCGAPFNLTCGQNFAGNNATGNSNWDAYGATYTDLTAPETIHQLVIPAGVTRTITLSNLTADLDLISIGTNCNQTGPFIGSNNGGNTTETITVQNNGAVPATYYIVVDGYQGATSPYTLSCN